MHHKQADGTNACEEASTARQQRPYPDGNSAVLQWGLILADTVSVCVGVHNVGCMFRRSRPPEPAQQNVCYELAWQIVPVCEPALRLVLFSISLGRSRSSEYV